MADLLDEYRAKRDLERSGEPGGRLARPRPGAPRFVVQEHQASRLHWDLRLEHDGVLASWALPRFLPNAGGDNRLAVRTEDHPVDYLTFEGEIPAGSYGAGTMRIYDEGTYEPLLWEPGKVEVELHGSRLTGRWALFPIGREGGGREWMIHRMGEPLDPGAEPLPPAPPPMLARAGALPSGDRWAYEVKWDGVRALCRSEPGRLAFSSRTGTDITAAYPELGALGRALREHAAILDGEIVAFDPAGDPPRPSFELLQRRMHVRDERRVRRLAAEVPVTYIGFDLLWLDGHSLTGASYDARRALLLGLGLDGPHWQVPEGVTGPGAGERLLEAARELGLEGVVAKRRDGPYEAGRRSGAWTKVRLRETADLVVGGWMAGEGGRSTGIGALLLGEPGGDGGLRYVGRAGSGLSDAELRDLQGRLAEIEAGASPFTAGPAPPAGAHWVHPQLVGRVAFSERSSGGLLRQPVWLGLRADVAAPLVFEDERAVRGKGRAATARTGARMVPVTNLDKPLFADGTTKRAVIEYAAAVAPAMLTHLRGRALTLVRCPDGTAGERFFEKRAPGHRPDWVTTAEVPYGRERIEHIVADDAATLVWLAQLAAIELHPSLALAAAPDRPTAVVFDLDPGAPATVVACCEVALLLRGMLEGVGLRSIAKTSGSKGLQVYVPLNGPDATFAATKAFARAVAEVLRDARPDLVVAKQAKTIRAGRVLVDWYQNDAAKTTIGVYSLRAREHPTVSTPVTWDEVETAAAAQDPVQLRFTATDVLRRIEASGDLFADVAILRQGLPAGL